MSITVRKNKTLNNPIRDYRRQYDRITDGKLFHCSVTWYYFNSAGSYKVLLTCSNETVCSHESNINI